MSPRDVVAAIIKKDDCYLLAKRNKEKYMGLKWEFPGGKVEKDESFEEALSREILEELNVNIEIHNKVAEERYQDDEINIVLHYYMCSLIDRDIVLSEHEAIKWVKKQDFLNYEFVPGDGDITSLI
ncbi:MAG: (deoxy)nucleoside triphosphate pyrophosphohydrolase [Candidatus Pseudothioglobus sp.]